MHGSFHAYNFNTNFRAQGISIGKLKIFSIQLIAESVFQTIQHQRASLHSAPPPSEHFREKYLFEQKRKLNILNYREKSIFKIRIFFFFNVKTILCIGIEITIQLGRTLKSVAIIFLTCRVILKLAEWKHKI